MRGLHKLFAMLAVGALLALPAGALAQSSTGGYNQPGGVVQEQIQTQPAQAQSAQQAPAAAAPAAKSQGGPLPFTGLDLALVVGAGGLLMLLGVGLRRFTRADEAA